jgi:hypothetical protein
MCFVVDFEFCRSKAVTQLLYSTGRTINTKVDAHTALHVYPFPPMASQIARFSCVVLFKLCFEINPEDL